MPSGKVGHHPGWKPLQGSATTMSQARLHARAGSPDPSEGTCKSMSVFHRHDRNEHPPASERQILVCGQSVRGRVCAALTEYRGRVCGQKFPSGPAVLSILTPKRVCCFSRLCMCMCMHNRVSVWIASIAPPLPMQIMPAMGEAARAGLNKQVTGLYRYTTQGW